MDILTNKNQSAEKDTLRYGKIFGRYPDKKIEDSTGKISLCCLFLFDFEKMQTLFKESVNNLFLGFFFGKSQCHKLYKLFSGNFTDCRFMNKTCVNTSRCNLRNSAYTCVVHNNCIAFCVSPYTLNFHLSLK